MTHNMQLFITLAVIIIAIIIIIKFRRVVPSNEFHYVQNTKGSKAYGLSTGNTSVYLEWPSWFPCFGVIVAIFPAYIWKYKLDNIAATSKDGKKITIDVVGLFHISDPLIMGEYVDSIDEFKSLLKDEGVQVINQITKICNIAQVYNYLEFEEKISNELLKFSNKYGVNINRFGIINIKETDSPKYIDTIINESLDRIYSDSAKFVQKKTTWADQEIQSFLESKTR